MTSLDRIRYELTALERIGVPEISIERAWQAVLAEAAQAAEADSLGDFPSGVTAQGRAEARAAASPICSPRVPALAFTAGAGGLSGVRR